MYLDNCLLFDLLVHLLVAKQRLDDELLDKGLYFIVEAPNAAAKKKPHVASHISNEAIRVIDYVLLSFLI